MGLPVSQRPATHSALQQDSLVRGRRRKGVWPLVARSSISQRTLYLAGIPKVHKGGVGDIEAATSSACTAAAAANMVLLASAATATATTKATTALSTTKTAACSVMKGPSVGLPAVAAATANCAPDWSLEACMDKVLASVEQTNAAGLSPHSDEWKLQRATAIAMIEQFQQHVDTARFPCFWVPVQCGEWRCMSQNPSAKDNAAFKKFAHFSLQGAARAAFAVVYNDRVKATDSKYKITVFVLDSQGTPITLEPFDTPYTFVRATTKHNYGDYREPCKVINSRGRPGTSLEKWLESIFGDNCHATKTCTLPAVADSLHRPAAASGRGYSTQAALDQSIGSSAMDTSMTGLTARSASSTSFTTTSPPAESVQVRPADAAFDAQFRMLAQKAESRTLGAVTLQSIKAELMLNPLVWVAAVSAGNVYARKLADLCPHTLLCAQAVVASTLLQQVESALEDEVTLSRICTAAVNGDDEAWQLVEQVRHLRRLGAGLHQQ